MQCDAVYFGGLRLLHLWKVLSGKLAGTYTRPMQLTYVKLRHMGAGDKCFHPESLLPMLDQRARKEFKARGKESESPEK